MKEKRISFGQGKGSLTHNNRTFIAKNVDESRIADNVVFISQPIGDAYEYLFADSVQRYNARQKRNDRKIHGTYYQSLFHQEPSNTVVTAADKRKSFYEDIVQIGKMEDLGFGTEDFSLVAECLKEYMNGFQERNPNFYVFNAVLHMDEATPHLHIDYIPIAHHKRGMDTQNGIAKALEEMGFGIGKMAIARWRASEVEVLNKICREHGIEPLPPEKSRGTLECEEYREQRIMAEGLAIQNEQAQADFESKQKTVNAMERIQHMKEQQLISANAQLNNAKTILAETKQEIADSEEKLSTVTADVEKADAELFQKLDDVNDLMRYLPDIDKNQKSEHKYLVVASELHDMLKSGMSILRNKDSIISSIDTLKGLCQDAQTKQDKADLAIYALRERGDEFLAERDKAIRERNEYRDKYDRSERENTKLREKISYFQDLLQLLETMFPSIFEKIKTMLQARYDKEYEQEQQRIADRKKIYRDTSR